MDRARAGKDPPEGLRGALDLPATEPSTTHRGPLHVDSGKARHAVPGWNACGTDRHADGQGLAFRPSRRGGFPGWSCEGLPAASRGSDDRSQGGRNHTEEPVSDPGCRSGEGRRKTHTDGHPGVRPDSKGSGALSRAHSLGDLRLSAVGRGGCAPAPGRRCSGRHRSGTGGIHRTAGQGDGAGSHQVTRRETGRSDSGRDPSADRCTHGYVCAR